MRTHFSPSLWLIVIFFAALNIVLSFMLPAEESAAWLSGYTLGLTAVLIHLFSSVFNQKSSDEKFTSIYFFSLLVRFLIVCSIFILVLLTTKIDEFSFTVSFIISYIFHSVNEVIFLNRKLTN
jgi:drug/metabolite transporter (DMT)-like permease